MVNYFFEETEEFELNQEGISGWLEEVASKDCDTSIEELNVVFCSDEYLLSMNNEYLEHDYYTDIITFEYNSKPVMGDLFISIDRVKDNANQNNKEFLNELCRVVVHGTLHILGYKDKSDAEASLMRSKEDWALSFLCFT